MVLQSVVHILWVNNMDVTSYGIYRFVGEVVVANMADKCCSVGTAIDVRRKQ